MDDFDAALAIASALLEAAGASMLRLRQLLPNDLRPSGPTMQRFSIDGRDAGVAVEVYGTRPDGRRIGWVVEAHMYAAGPDNWAINVKAEIDLDDREGDDRCVLNEQQTITELANLPDAIATATRLVVGYPLHELLTAGWEPADWELDDPELG